MEDASKTSEIVSEAVEPPKAASVEAMDDQLTGGPGQGEGLWLTGEGGMTDHPGCDKHDGVSVISHAEGAISYLDGCLNGCWWIRTSTIRTER
ncbi:hypothetical protein [Streptomyces sp. NPDC054765]